MSAAIFSLVLFAALLHAVWNAIVKVAPDKTLTAILVAISGATVSAFIVPMLPQPATAAWPFLAFSTVLQVGYYALVAGAYRGADMSLAYPLMRGLAPLIVALVTAFGLGDRLTPSAWVGIALVSAGVIGTALGARGSGNGRGAAFALGNAVVIAAYTISDGLGARASGAPVAYTMWLTILTALPLIAWVIAFRPDFAAYARRYAGLGFVGGVATLTSYGLALWAMTLAPVAVIAALRETSILFGTAIAALVLRERVTPGRLAAIALIAAGAVALRLA
ncbi:MAG TPA: EamA family transporter [Bauldia sp.]|nr:EamA family transporter [Bauldia sp.]